MKNPLKNKRAFSLAEILIALVIVIFVILGAGSAHIGAHNFFTSIKQHSQIQDEVKIAIEHISKNIQGGIGDLNNPAFTISGGNTVIEVNVDRNSDGKFVVTDDNTISYTYLGAPNYKIVYDPDIRTAGNELDITDDLISLVSFSAGSTLNEIDITIEALSNPAGSEAIDNPKASLTSTIAIKGMSCR